MVVFVFGLPEEFVIDIDGLPVLSHVEVAVGEPETVLYLDVHVTLALQKGNRSDPISLLHEILERGHFLLLHLRVGAVFGS